MNLISLICFGPGSFNRARRVARAGVLALLGVLANSAITVRGQAGLTWQTNHLLPTFSAAATNIAYLGGSGVELTLFASLEGIVNRTQPRIATQSTEWMGIHNINYTTLSNPYTAITTYGTNVTGLVVTDPNLPDTLNLATTIAGVKNELICDPSLLNTLTNAPYNLAIKDDLRGMFTDKYGVYGYLYTNYWGQCTHRIITGANTNILGSVRDYVVAVKSACVWLDGSVPADAAALAPFLTSMGPMGGLWMGWVPNEDNDLPWIAQYGIPVLASDTYNNGSLYSGVHVPINIPPIPAAPPLANKIYVAFIMSDGDNAGVMQGHMFSTLDWFDPARGTIPLGWTTEPLCCDLDSGMLNYYWTNASPDDVMVAGPDGAGYLHDEFWSATNLYTYTATANPYLQQGGQRTITVWNTVPASTADSYASNCPTLVGLIQEQAGYETTSYDNLAVIGFPSGASYAESPAILLNSITNQGASWDGKTPMFIMAQADCWSNTPTQVAEVASQLGTNYVLVRPDVLFLLYREQAGLGPAAATPYVAAQPSSQSALAGTNITLSVIATGSSPLSYQWQFDGTNIAGATNALYTLFNAESSDSGYYSVQVTNIAGSVTSSNAQLQIIGSTPLIPTNGLIFHWNMDETGGLTAHDVSTNGNNGSLVGTNWPGDTGCTLPANSQWISNGHLNGALHLNPGVTGTTPAPTRVEISSLTQVEVWGNSPATTNSRTWALWVRLGANNVGFQNLIGEPTGAGAGNNLGFDATGYIPRVLWNNGGTGSATIQSAAGAIPTNVWTHLALTYDYQNQSNLTLYVNGSVQANATLATVRPFLGTIELGTRGNYEYAFQGDVDEVYVYNRALSAGEIASLAGVAYTPPQITTSLKNIYVWQGQPATMSVATSGVGTMSYQWYNSNNQPIAGQTNAQILIDASAQPADDGVYAVIVTNLVGAATSSASLFVLPLKVIPPSAPFWIPTNGLVFYWNMDNTTNFEALDYSGNNNHGMLLNFPTDGSQQVPGFIGNSLYIHSTNGSLPQVVVTNLPMITNLTWACWVKIVPSGDACAMSSSFPGAVDGSSLGFGGTTNDTHPRILWNHGVASTTLQGPAAVDYNDWNQIGCTYSQSNSLMTLYLNGEPIGVNDNCTSTPFNWMAVGIRLAQQAESLNGDIDEVLCYNRALSPSEMQTLYLNSITNGQLPFRYVEVSLGNLTTSTNNSAPYGLTGHFVNVPPDGFFEVSIRTLWTNGAAVLWGTTNLSKPWQVLTGAQYGLNGTPELIGTIPMTNSIHNLKPDTLFIRGSAAEPAPLFYDDFQSGAPGWTHGGQNDSWALGVPINGPSGGPHEGYNGETNVYCTGLNTVYNGAEAAWLHSPPINLGGLQQATIVYWEWADFYPDTLFDYGQVNLVDATTLQPVASDLWQVSDTTTNYTASGWVQRVIDIPSPNTMSSTNVEIEFMMNTDPYNPAHPGWFLDNVEVLPYGNPY